MKKIQSLFIALILMFVTVFSVYATEFKNIVVFGDSLSDNGNLFNATGTYPPAPYYQGRSSDGLVWSEYIAEELGFNGILLNYAYAGAQAGNTNVHDDDFNGDFSGFLDEVKAYLDLVDISLKYPGGFAMPQDTLFIIWIGNNNFLNGVTDPATEIAKYISNIQNALSQLIDAGASKFIVINLPDYGKIPRFNKNQTASLLATQLAVGVNQALEQFISGIKTAYPNITINQFDVFPIISEVTDNAAIYGFTNMTDAKLNKSDGTIAEGAYFFWDDIHPTTFAHKFFAKKIAEAINCENCKDNMMPYLENDLTLKVPSAKLGDYNFGFTLVPYLNPAEPNGIFWTLDLNSLEVK